MKTYSIITPEGIYALLRKLVKVERNELRALLWSFIYFFSLLCSYYILRPMRDEMGIAGGVENLQWLFTGTLLIMLAVVPLFGWITSRFQRRQFLPWVYYFFIIQLLLFYLLFAAHQQHVYIARSFFIWVSVFNLFVVSVFWSFMTDIYSSAQSKRLFGFIAAGGTSGALTGPALTTALVTSVGVETLLLFSVAFLLLAVFSIHRLIAWQQHSAVEQSEQAEKTNEAVIGGTVWAGIRLVTQSPYLMGIVAFIILYTTLSTFLYFQQAQIVKESFISREERTAVFAAIDLAVNALTLITQMFITSRLIQKVGLAWTLALIPALLSIGFLALGISPVLMVLVVVQVLRRAGNYAIMRPAREMLFVVLGREEKYKAKNFIDTVIYRGGDAVSSWIYTGFRSLGVSLAGMAYLALPLALVWAWLGYRLGKQQQSYNHSVTEQQ